MENIAHIAEHVLEHSVSDTLYLIPFLFVTYLLMEWLEHKTAGRTQEAIRHAGAAGPVVGALLGVVPQCGFSAMAATLWAGRVITLGTLFAVFLSTSDEMLPIFLAEQVPATTILSVMGAKVVVGMVMGFIVDAAMRLARRDRQDLRIHELCERDNCGCHEDCAACEENPALVYGHHDDALAAACARAASDAEARADHAALKAATEYEGLLGDLAAHAEHPADAVADSTHDHVRGCCSHDHSHDHDHGWKGIAKSALVHTVQVTVFIFVITLALNAVLEVVGEDVLADFLGANPTVSVLASALVGLIPNCAASVVIAELYLEGVLGSRGKILNIIIRELEAVAKKYGKPRRTILLYADELEEVEIKEEIPDYPVHLFFTKEGYFKKITPQSLRMSGDHKLKEGDGLSQQLEGQNSGELLFF